MILIIDIKNTQNLADNNVLENVDIWLNIDQSKKGEKSIMPNNIFNDSVSVIESWIREDGRNILQSSNIGKKNNYIYKYLKKNNGRLFEFELSIKSDKINRFNLNKTYVYGSIIYNGRMIRLMNLSGYLLLCNQSKS